jgi:hypothetical protein
MAHPVFLTAGDEERLVRVADDVVVADMPDEEAPIGERELEPWREALGAFADRSSFTDVFDQADGELASCRGFLWQNGAMTDLNSIVAPGYSDHIYAAGDINDLGRITGQAFNPTTNEYSAFLAVPEHGNGRGQSGTASPRERANGRGGAPLALPEHLRQMLLQRLALSD